MKHIQVFNFFWLLIYQLFLKLFVHAVAILPAIWFLVYPFNSTINHAFSIVGGIFLYPVLLTLQTGMLLLIFPKPKSGKYPLFSRQWRRWLRSNIIAEFVSGSSSINNIIQRISPLKIIYYYLLGYKNPVSLILAPEVKLLDPDRCRFGKRVFIGYGTVISGHTVKGNKLIIDETVIHDDSKLGSFCKLAVGVHVGRNTFIDYGVEIGMNTKIGNNVKIFASVKIDDEVAIEDNCVIGKGTTIGRKTKIGKGSVVGGYCRIGSRIDLAEKSRITEMTDIRQ